MKLSSHFIMSCTSSVICSIHPQGWVPIETGAVSDERERLWGVAFTPKGGCPLKQLSFRKTGRLARLVAFTPKGGCPLKLPKPSKYIETITQVAFTPKGGCPLKRNLNAATASATIL